MRALIVLQRKAELLKVILALNSTRRLPGLLDGGKQKPDQDCDDPDDDEQFDKSKGPQLLACEWVRHEMALDVRRIQRPAIEWS
jgi:hypothetical protein